MKLNMKQKMLLAAGTIALTTGSALADASAAMEAIKSEAESVIADAWPIAIVVVIAMVGIKLFKKFASKAS